MSAWTLLLIAVGVSADAFAVALGKGLSLRTLRVRDALTVAAVFGGFQAVMPVIGWLLGTGLEPYVAAVDHWVAFALLTAIGAKMIWEASRADVEVAAEPCLRLPELLVLGVATSIDALAVGISLAVLDVDLIVAAATIGLVTAVVCFAGVHAGHRLGLRLRRPAEAAGGLLLIAIGVGVLIDHLG